MNESAVQKELEAIRKDLKQLQADTIKLKDDSKDLTSEMVNAARQKLEAETQKLLSRLQDSATGFKQHGQETISMVEKKVEENPLISILTAGGIGFIVGWLVSRK